MFALKPNPTFKSPVSITVPGGEDAVITFIFKHKSKKQLADFFSNLTSDERSDTQKLLDLVAGWEGVDAPFSEENFEALLDNYPSATMAIIEGYNKALFESKRGNSPK